MTYPGGKAGGGVYQTIINHIPPHEVYIEPFAGGECGVTTPGRIKITHDLNEVHPDAQSPFSTGCDRMGWTPIRAVTKQGRLVARFAASRFSQNSDPAFDQPSVPKPRSGAESFVKERNRYVWKR